MPGDDPRALTKVTAMKDRTSKMVAGHLVPVKGTGHKYPLQRVVKTLDEWGRGDIILRSDDEPSIVDLKRAVKERRIENTLLEEAPVGDHQANSVAETAVQSIAGRTRSIKSALEARVGSRIGSTRAIVLWMIEVAAFTANHYAVGEDGKSAYERLKGKRSKVAVAEFGESILTK